MSMTQPPTTPPDPTLLRREVPEVIRRALRTKESQVGERLRHLWRFTNRREESFIFAAARKSKDATVYTLAHYHPTVGWCHAL